MSLPHPVQPYSRLKPISSVPSQSFQGSTHRPNHTPKSSGCPHSPPPAPAPFMSPDGPRGLGQGMKNKKQNNCRVEIPRATPDPGWHPLGDLSAQGASVQPLICRKAWSCAIRRLQGGKSVSRGPASKPERHMHRHPPPAALVPSNYTPSNYPNPALTPVWLPRPPRSAQSEPPLDLPGQAEKPYAHHMCARLLLRAPASTQVSSTEPGNHDQRASSERSPRLGDWVLGGSVKAPSLPLCFIQKAMKFQHLLRASWSTAVRDGETKAQRGQGSAPGASSPAPCA